MAYIYREIKENGERVCIQRISDTAYIPLNEDNSDYQKFLQLVAELGESEILEPAE